MPVILIIEGNSEPIIEDTMRRGLPVSCHSYRDALALHEPGWQYHHAYPFARHREKGLLPLEAYDGFVQTGSAIPQTAGKAGTEPYMRLLEDVLDTGKPVLGSCWGLQTAAVALGGEVEPNHRGAEIGLALDIELTDEGAAHPLFAGMPRRFHSPCWHRDHVTKMPEGAVRLAGNATSEVQAMEYCRNGVDYLGFQYHPETPLQEMKAWYDAAPDLHGAPNVIVNFPLTPDFHVTDEQRRTRALGNWLRHVATRTQTGD
jgi:GMP synthase (glutamine-hydrolysing)